MSERNGSRRASRRFGGLLSTEEGTKGSVTQFERSRGLRLRILRIAPLLAALGALLWIPVPEVIEGPLLRPVLDAAHLPLFAAVTWVLVKQAEAARRPRPLWAAFSVSVLLVVATEAVQNWVPSRQGSAHDMVLGVSGAILAITGVASRRSAMARAAVYFLLPIVVIWQGLTIVQSWRLEAWYQRRMPLLADFDDSRDVQRWTAKDDTRVRVIASSGAAGGGELEVRCDPSTYPGVSVQGFGSDWRGFRTLAFDLDATGTEPLLLHVRVDEDGRTGSSYTGIIVASPGRRTYRLALADVHRSSLPSPMNMARIGELHFFLDHPSVGRVFRVDVVRLER